LPNPGAGAELRAARKKYGIIKALQRGRAVDAGGIINPQTFKNNYAKVSRNFANGKDKSEFAQVINTTAYLTSRQTGNSGTATRLAGAAGLAGNVSIGGAGIAGVNALFE
jgi:hypothetical protein